MIYMIDVHDEETNSFPDIVAATLWDDGSHAVVPIKERLVIEAFIVEFMNFASDGIEENDEIMLTLYGNGYHNYAPKKFYVDLKNRMTPLARPSIEKPPCYS